MGSFFPMFPVLVILGSMFFRAENGVGFINFLHLGGVQILIFAGMKVGMMLARDTAIGLPDFLVRGSFGNLEHVIIIPERGIHRSIVVFQRKQCLTQRRIGV
jgi:hypothetical protein